MSEKIRAPKLDGEKPKADANELTDEQLDGVAGGGTPAPAPAPAPKPTIEIQSFTFGVKSPYD
jgi:hypothetical protein